MVSDRVLLFTDAVDSTLLTERLGDTAASALWAEHDRLARQLLRRWRGHEIDKSDGFLLTFETVADAAAFAADWHRALSTLQPPLSSRAGIHRATMLTREIDAVDQALGAKALELDGIGKAVASRIMMLARGGQTLLSAAARHALDDARWRLRSHGHWRLKGMADPLELFEVGDDQTIFHPPPDSSKAYRVLRSGEGWTPVAAQRHGLPGERDDFIGRGDALGVLARCFDADARLVSLLGIGGIGKTRLAVRFARDWLGDFPGGAWFCDLSAARGLDGIVHAVAQGLDVPLGKTDPARQLGAAIDGRGDCLVVLDNFEQVTRFAEQTVGLWMSMAPRARFLVTTRELLGIAGEQVMPLAPLGADEAVCLFERRARAVHPDFAFEGDGATTLPRLVDLLDRLPLAIELAAARVRVMSVQDMIDHMHERFLLLASRRDPRDRQSTLRTALDWSWDLLAADEKTTLMELAVFEGGFTAAAAQAVLQSGASSGAAWVADRLQALLDKSLLNRTGERRFSFLRTVLDYLTERGRERPDLVRSAELRHARYFADLAEPDAVRTRGVETENLMLATRRAMPEQPGTAVRALANLWAALRMTGPMRAVAPLVQALDAAALTDGERARLYAVWAGVLHQSGDLTQALAQANSGLDWAERQSDASTLAALELTAADVLRSLGRLGESAERAKRSLVHARESADDLAALKALNSLGTVHYARGDIDEAKRHYLQALDLARAPGRERWMGGLLGNLALLSQAEGNGEEALARFNEALDLAGRIGDRQWEGNNRSNLALLQYEQGLSAAAAEQLARSLRIAREIGHGRLERVVLCNLGIVLGKLQRDDEALASFESALTLCVASGDKHAESEFRGHLALHLAERAHFDRALSELHAALQCMRTLDDVSALALLLCQGAVVAAGAGRTIEAAAYRDEATSLLGTQTAGPRADCAGLLDRVRELLSRC